MGCLTVLAVVGGLGAAAWLSLAGSGRRLPAAVPGPAPAQAIGECSGVQVSAGADVQAAVDSFPAGTTFCLAPGTYHPSSLVPKTGDVIDGGNRRAVLDGGGSVAYAIMGSSSDPDVTIRGLTIRNYASPLQRGALQSFGTSGWVIENNHVTRNAGAGITFDGGARVIGNLLDYNKEEGYACRGDDDLFQGNEVAYNNSKLTVDPEWEAGGGKCWATRRLTMKDNYSHNNGGPGLWTDTDNVFTTYEGNTVTSNYGPGIMHEISWSATIVNNTVTDNGMAQKGGWLWDAGILLSSSGGQDAADPIVVAHNTVIDNYNGISVVEQRRGSGAFGTYQAQNIHISDNTVTMDRGVTGMGAMGHDPGVWNRNIIFTGNTYTVPAASGVWFAWRGSFRRWARWQGYGNDASGRIMVSRTR